MILLRYYDDAKALIEITDTDISAMLADQTRKDDLANFIYNRHYYRYIKPFEYKAATNGKNKNNKLIDEYSLYHKNGFPVMASSCLLIETLESFYRGWKDTSSKSEMAFLKFFGRDKNFSAFAIDDLASQFYKHVRCGILHQGETTGGWSLSRDTTNSFFDPASSRINPTLFLKRLNLSLNAYKSELSSSDWNTVIWSNARTKLKSVIMNCKP